MSEESKDKISLENFNYQSKHQRLTFPSSIKACKLQGVTEVDLLFISFEDYIKTHPESKNLPKEFQQERYDNYEQNRKDLIEELKELRNNLKNEEKKHIKRQKTETEVFYNENSPSKTKPTFITISNQSKDDYKQKLN